jgi:hypothetical protein
MGRDRRCVRHRFAIGIAGFARLGLDGIFRILNDLPAAAVGAGLSVTLALAGLAIAAVFAVVWERQYGGRQRSRSTT